MRRASGQDVGTGWEGGGSPHARVQRKRLPEVSCSVFAETAVAEVVRGVRAPDL